MNKIFGIHLWRNSFIYFAIFLIIFVIVLNLRLLKVLTSALVIQPPLEFQLFIHLAYNEDKVIYFLCIFVLIYILDKKW